MRVDVSVLWHLTYARPIVSSLSSTRTADLTHGAWRVENLGEISEAKVEPEVEAVSKGM